MASAVSFHKISAKEVNDFRNCLLTWYDKNRRVLPWRALAGRRADPYHVWLSEIMLQQTVVAAVIPYFTKFVEKWPTVQDLASAPLNEVMADWAGLGYYARARNLYKCAQVVANEYKGKFPRTRAGLKALLGIGEYTSAAIAAIAYDLPATVIDGNVDRVIARYFAIEEPLPAGKKSIRHYAEILSEGRTDRPGDFAQAMMDLGATICIPKAARCPQCPLAAACRGRKQAIQNELPKKLRKRAKPQKHGYVYWVTDDRGRVLLERRPEEAMMGGMLALPVSEWVSLEDRPAHDSEISTVLKSVRAVKGLEIRHSFTHFDLILYGCRARADAAAIDGKGRFLWLAPDKDDIRGLPSLFTKAAKMFGKIKA